MSEALLRRYKKYSEQFVKEVESLREWAKTQPIGQPSPSYERASTKLSTFKRRKITPLWFRLRSKIVKNNKTLWQLFPWTTQDEPPLFSEIEPFLTNKRKRRN